MAGGENARRKGEKITQIYNSLPTIEEKIDYLLELDMHSMAVEGTGGKLSDQEWEAFQDAKQKFIEEYLRGGDENTQKRVYDYIGKLFTQNDLEMYLKTQENLKSLPEDMQRREKAAYWLTRNASLNGMKIPALKELTQEFDSAMIDIPQFRERVTQELGFDENTTMEQYAKIQGYSSAEEIQEYLETMEAQPDDKALEFLNTHEVSLSEIKDKLVMGATQKWIRQGQADYLQNNNLNVQITEEIKRGIEDINEKNKDDLSDNGIQEWVKQEGKSKAKQFDISAYGELEKKFQEKYVLPYEKQEWKDLEQKTNEEKNRRYQEESRIAACSFREGLTFGEAKEELLNLEDSAEATVKFLQDQKVLQGLSNAKEGLKKEEWVAESMGNLFTEKYGDLVKRAGMQESDAFLIDGKSPKELWGDKYKNVEEPALKEKCYQVEVLKKIAEGKSEIGIKTIGLGANGKISETGSVMAFPKAEAIRDLKLSHAIYQSGMKSMANELKEIQTQLLWSHEKTDLDKARKEIGKIGSEYFQEMERTLDEAIKALENKNLKPEQVEKKLGAYKKAADTYAKERDSIFGKHSDKGVLRLDMAKKGGQVVPQILTNYKNLQRSLSSKLLYDQDQNFSDLEPEEANKAFSETFGSQKWNDLYGLDQVNTSERECQNYVEKMRDVSNAQVSAENMMKKGIATLGKTTEKINRVASQANPDPLEAALAYRQARFRKKLYKEGVSASAVKGMEKELEQKIKDGSFKADVEKLSKNPVFKATVKANPQQFEKEWRQIEKQTDIAIGHMKKALEELKTDHPDLSKYVHVGNANGKKAENTQDQKYARLGDIVTKQLLTDPAGRTVVQAIESGQMDYAEVVKAVTGELKKKEILNDAKVSHAQLRESLHNGDLKRMVTENVGKQTTKNAKERVSVQQTAQAKPKEKKIGK